MTPGRDAAGRRFNFVSPSPEALAISLAHKAAVEAGLTLRNLEARAPRRVREEWAVDGDDLARLFDYFEACFVAVTLSYQSLEAFANRVIDDRVEDTYEWARAGEPVTMTKAELQRQVATEAKLSTILPKLAGVPSPKGRAPWDSFRRLKRVRDAVVHIKADDAYPRHKPDTQSLFHRLVVDGVGHHPRVAVGMIAWFYQGQEKPAWLTEAERLVKPAP